MVLPLSLLSLLWASTYLRSTHASRQSLIVTNNSKAGLAWPNGDFVDIQQFTKTGKVSWYYTWGPIGVDTTDIEFVPMLWGADQVDQFTSSINRTLQRTGATAVLGMNEPQETGQSNLTPEQGVAMWTAYLEPLKSQGVRLGSPAPSGAPSGKQWLLDWLGACGNNCTVDFIALHWYDVNATKFQEYLEDFHSTFQRPLWVTEWTCQNFNNATAQCSPEDIIAFMNQTQSFMDSTLWVERYAWFGAMENLQGVNPEDGLMTSTGKINSLGMQYINESSTSSATPSIPPSAIIPSLAFPVSRNPALFCAIYCLVFLSGFLS
ncbi:hypothetical protein SISNIDRAFT_453466 [Sistotremastrum niveocremeum HHB9708]|uniref:Asl1-like glycosyl hydrolase catalytic domain-containing protein n=2 Tax=Sistotremastraceae TaxID=3402574 RepID=A0A164VWK6_9AGAM|nr:hypothetical protein SISNIDRAFT_453466 [Sistotremastrum niveocremeum HHB9708]KZT43199.1 hypothetical protein SISSUDRAFT_1040653 [Sistotremastrum suecicum HHB10207 ss-3]